MINKKSQFLNKVFLVFASAGFLIIFNQEKMETVASFLLPAGLVFIYALIVNSSSRRLNDFDLAEHHTESIYFLGFLFTLISLAVLFYRFLKMIWHMLLQKTAIYGQRSKTIQAVMPFSENMQMSLKL